MMNPDLPLSTASASKHLASSFTPPFFAQQRGWTVWISFVASVEYYY